MRQNDDFLREIGQIFKLFEIFELFELFEYLLKKYSIFDLKLFVFESDTLVPNLILLVSKCVRYGKAVTQLFT